MKKREIEPVVTRRRLGDPSAKGDDRRYWLSQTPQAGIDQVEKLCAEFHGCPENNEPLLQRVAESFNSHDVPYLIIGRLAMALYGEPRYTENIEIWLGSNNVEKAVKALADFGFASLDIKLSDFTSPNQVIQLGYPPHRIDLLTSASGVTFDDCYVRRKEFVIDGIVVNCVEVADLIANKRSTGRLQDLADIETLES